jgi:hypothetical protein
VADRSLLIWDNRATMHRAPPFDDASHRRELRRVTTLDAETPAAATGRAWPATQRCGGGGRQPTKS